MQKKEVKPVTKRKPTTPPPEPDIFPTRKLASKSTAKAKSRKKLDADKRRAKPTGAAKPAKVKSKKLIDIEGTLAGKRLVRNYLSVHKVPTLEEELLDHVQSELTSRGWSVDPIARMVLKTKVRQASSYLKSEGSPHKEVERTRILLKIFSQSFPIVTRGSISGKVMHRSVKRWLPCPPFCKEES